MSHAVGDEVPFSVVALGVVVAVLPIVLLPQPSGMFAIPLLVVKGVLAAIGLCVSAVGLKSYRTGNLRPAVATGLAVLGLIAVGTVGAVVEMTGGPLVPIPVWFVSGVSVVTLAVVAANHLVDE